MQFGNAAAVSRDMDTQNAKVFGERQQQSEQMNQNWGQMQMSRFKQLNSQRSQQSSLAQKLLEEQLGMASDWNVGLVRMGRWAPTTTVIA
jgi:transposase